MKRDPGVNVSKIQEADEKRFLSVSCFAHFHINFNDCTLQYSNPDSVLLVDQRERETNIDITTERQPGSIKETEEGRAW